MKPRRIEVRVDGRFRQSRIDFGVYVDPMCHETVDTRVLVAYSGAFSMQTDMTRTELLALASALAQAAESFEPLPVGEATESDFGALQEAQA